MPVLSAKREFLSDAEAFLRLRRTHATSLEESRSN